MRGRLFGWLSLRPQVFARIILANTTRVSLILRLCLPLPLGSVCGFRLASINSHFVAQGSLGRSRKDNPRRKSKSVSKFVQPNSVCDATPGRPWRQAPTKIFLSTPITGLLVRNEDGTLSFPHRSRLEFICKSLRDAFDCSLFCAIELEDWGSNVADAFSLTVRDYREIRDADIVLAFPGASYGTRVELEWASAFLI